VSKIPFSKPVEESVSKVKDEVAVGEDLKFQGKWWRFEQVVWTVITLILIADVAGAFGRGPLAKAERRSSDGTMDIQYERIERTGTPSKMHIRFSPGAVHNGQIKLFVSESLVGKLGTQRVVPSPQSAVVGDGGLTYTFPASTPPMSIELVLQPSGPGVNKFTVKIPGADSVQARVVVVP
jgi:hypothetical protein